MVCATGYPKSPNIILYYITIHYFMASIPLYFATCTVYIYRISASFFHVRCFAEQRKAWANINWFLANKESISGAWAIPMHFHSLGELASEEPSEPGRIVGTLHLRNPLSLRRRRLAPLLQRNRRRQQDLAGESCVRGRCARRHWRRREPSWLRGI